MCNYTWNSIDMQLMQWIVTTEKGEGAAQRYRRHGRPLKGPVGEGELIFFKT
jgi:hypothetical protein